MASRGVYRSVFSALLDDPDFQRLSPHARLLFYTVRLCKAAGPPAIFRHYPAVLMAQSGLTARELDAALTELESGGWIVMDSSVLWVRNGLRHDPFMALADQKHRRAVERHVAELPHSPIVLSFCDYYKIARPFEGSAQVDFHVRTPFEAQKQIQKQKTETEREKEDSHLAKSEPATGFEAFWAAYPRKVSKADARRAWQRLAPAVALQATMLAALATQRVCADWLRENGRFIPYPATWLNGQRWLDECAPGPGAVMNPTNQQALTRFLERHP
jgi:hypothetical protein